MECIGAWGAALLYLTTYQQLKITLSEFGENIRLEIKNFWRFYICGLHPDALNLDSWTQKFAVIAFNIFITNGSNKKNAPNKGIWERIETSWG